MFLAFAVFFGSYAIFFLEASDEIVVIGESAVQSDFADIFLRGIEEIAGMSQAKIPKIVAGGELEVVAEEFIQVVWADEELFGDASELQSGVFEMFIEPSFSSEEGRVLLVWRCWFFEGGGEDNAENLQESPELSQIGSVACWREVEELSEKRLDLCGGFRCKLEDGGEMQFFLWISPGSIDRFEGMAGD